MAQRDLHEGCLSVSQPIAFLSRLAIQTTNAVQTSLSQSDPVTLTSYDLLPIGNDQIETIIVPGWPPVWSPHATPISLRPDGQQPLIRQSFPSFPMEPLFRAIAITAPETDFNSFDIFTDRRNLRLLLDFTSHRGQKQQEFRIDAEIVGNSVILSRWIDWGSRRFSGGYGKEFERVFTETPDCSRGSLVHKRAVGYTLGDLRLMVRFEVDACIQEAPADETPGGVVNTPNGHRIILQGALSKADAVAELKTTSISGRRNNDWKTLPQMWFSRTPILCQGFHRSGVFEEINVLDIQDRLEDWEQQSQEKIGKLVQVLKRLTAIIKEVEAQGNRFAVVCEYGGDCLKLYGLEDAYSFGLPQDLRKKWRSKAAEGLTGIDGLSI